MKHINTPDYPHEIDREEIDEWTGEVAETIEFDRLYVWDGRPRHSPRTVVGEQIHDDGTVTEVIFGLDMVRANHLKTITDIETALYEVWTRAGLET